MLEVAVANPLMPRMIEITSPQNNQVCPSNSVWLNFTALTNFSQNFTSFSYSIDGQESITTDGSTLMTGLGSGSHTLKIYGNSTHDDYTYNDQLLEVVYFSITYSTVWITFIIVACAFIAVTFLVLLVNRRSLVKRLKSKKTVAFWVGLVCFLGSGAVFVVPSTWQILGDYLFPHYKYGAITIYPAPFLDHRLNRYGFGFGIDGSWHQKRQRHSWGGKKPIKNNA